MENGLFREIFLHNFSRPLKARAESRKYCGPYRWRPSEPGKGRGFYSSRDPLIMGDAPLSLRLEWANDHLRGSRLSFTSGYYCDPDGMGDTLQPVIARLPRGRGFLAGWTMGGNMCGSLDSCIYSDETEAAYSAHSMAESDAESNRESYEEPEDEDAEDEDGEG